jgi:phosphoglucomutase/phosphomannomutase
MSDPLAQAFAGFAGVDADPAIKNRSGHYLAQWLDGVEFKHYRPQIEWLIETRQWAGLLDRFSEILPFGTGGRRGPVGIGPNRMNLWTLGASVQGHCEYLRQRFPGVEPLKVVLAYDVRQFEDQGRRYNPDLPNPVLHLSSRAFAQHATGVYVANGIHAHILPDSSSRYLATPELSFAIRTLNAHGGLNVSASHNPPDDNGAKFYDERGGQPVPPDDQIMAELVNQVTHIKGMPWQEAQRTGRIHLLDDAPHRAYVELCRKQSLIGLPRLDEIKVVFTPLHGVGSMTALEILQAQGFRPIPVEEQMRPDGQFPNVTQTPNPEVPAAMDRAEALAQQVGADLVLATDPDADRLGAMIPGVRSQVSGVREDAAWRALNGNEIAAILTHFKLSKLAELGTMPRSPIVIRTVVTSGQVSRIARSFGAQVIENLLVGFKYVAEALWQLEQTGAYEDVQGTPADFVLACEESMGYLLTPQIRDKDAGASALVLAEAALDQKRRGRTLGNYLEQIGRQVGYFRNTLQTIALPGIEGKENMARMLDRLRASPPEEIAGLRATAFEDLRNQDNWLGPIKGATDLAARNFLIFHFGERARISVRPSGTEPKAKLYIEACSAACPAGASESKWRTICQEVDAVAGRLATDFVNRALQTAK